MGIYSKPKNKNHQICVRCRAFGERERRPFPRCWCLWRRGRPVSGRAAANELSGHVHARISTQCAVRIRRLPRAPRVRERGGVSSGEGQRRRLLPIRAAVASRGGGCGPRRHVAIYAERCVAQFFRGRRLHPSSASAAIRTRRRGGARRKVRIQAAGKPTFFFYRGARRSRSDGQATLFADRADRPDPVSKRNHETDVFSIQHITKSHIYRLTLGSYGYLF